MKKYKQEPEISETQTFRSEDHEVRELKKRIRILEDRGSQYASNDYQQLLQEHHFQVSMSRRGNCYDNACMESFHSLIKKECIYLNRFRT
ncbi:DDE-type integrase/transposase/recombinase, partial [Aeribacillus pallidus]|uniref:DDE-type integrase/transposase/recombinase n=1 Tax=Aeribacillus pallidus TaxID=33936 RepID=UPI000B29ED72